MKTDERRTRMHHPVGGVRRRGEGYPCQGTRIIGRDVTVLLVTIRICIYASECETSEKDRSPEAKPFVSDFMRRRQGGGEGRREDEAKVTNDRNKAEKLVDGP